MHSLLSGPSQAKQAISLMFLSLGLLFVMHAHDAKAHELTPAVTDVIFTEGAYELRIEANLEAIIAEIGPDHDDTNSSPNARRYDELRKLDSQSLREVFRDFADEFVKGVTIQVDATPNPLAFTQADIPETGDLEIPRISVLTLSGQLPDGAEFLVWEWAEKYGPVVLRTQTDVAGQSYAALLSGGERSEPIAVSGQKNRSGWAVFIDYIGIGFEHILPLGLDHILFVIGLFLLSAKLRPLITQISAFTLAHTVTLALGMLGIINIPGSIVEPIIAASIVYVAIENILMPNMSKWRPYVVFGFGLLHGLGFAGVLTEFGIPTGQFVTALIGFNIGVELGQLTVIALCFVLIGAWFGNASWYRRAIIIPGSVIIALIGAYWFIERTVL